MRGSFRIGAILGIPLEINPSWLITLTFFMFILGEEIYPDALKGQPVWFYWALAAVSGIFFFSSIIVHEIAHSLVARRYQIPVRAITLFMLGGVSQISRDAKRPLAEFLMAIVGPLTSASLAGVFLGLVYTPGLRDNRTNVMWQWLFVMNVSLAVVNMAPGFPLDGGRVLRAALWGATGSYRKATRWASLVGRGLGYALIAGGLLTLIGTIPWLDQFSGAWFILVGLFLDNAARQSWNQLLVLDALRRHRAAEVMRTTLPAIYGTATVLETMSRYYEPRAGLCAFVVDGEERVIGMVSETETARTPKERWAVTQAGNIMRPVTAVATAAPDTDLAALLEQMDLSQQNQMPIVEDGRLIGHVGRTRILGVLMAERELAANR